jgi:alpha-tubulin suppressor-like RCC1 family protein
VPVTVSGLSGAAEVSAGGSHTLARRASTGGARSWGHNSHGQLGTGNTTTRRVSGPVNGLA